MKSTKLINLLKTFSEDEMKSFKKFTASPYFNSVKNYIKLLNELEKFYPEFDNEKLTNEYIFKRLYKDKPFNKQIIWNMTSGLEKLAIEFLENLALKKNTFKRMELLVPEFAYRRLLNNYSILLDEMEKLAESSGIEYNYFENKGHLETHKQGYYHLIDKIQPMSDSKLKASEYQILLFLRMTVGGLSDMLILSKSYNARFDVNIPMELAKNIDLKKVVQYAYNKKYEYAFLIEIYYHSLMFFIKPRETWHLYKVRTLYEANFDKFSASEKRTIMHWILNYCVQCSETYGPEYKKIIFELNEFRLREGLAFYPEGQIPKATYYLILNTAMALNKTEWAENFIKKYTPMLQPAIRQHIGAIANAFVHFQKKEYEKVLKNLSKIEFIDVRDKLYARSLLASTYYEMKEFETLLNHIVSTKNFLNKNKFISRDNRKSYGNFYSYLYKLILILERNEIQNLGSLSDKINSEKTFINKNWLIEKIEELS